MRRFFLAAFVFVLTLFSGFAEITVINPVEGKFANRQMLVIDTSDGADYFYSMNGSDPSLEGFAYDGPVLIDMTGDITVKITRGFSEQKEISFNVKTEYPESEVERNFIYSFSDTGVLNYFSGSEIQVPKSFAYSFEQVPETFIPGRVLKYSENCSLYRFIPCTVTDGKLFWRFFIRTSPKSSGTFSRRDLPVTIKNWNIISFEDDDLIYRFDDEFWYLPKESRILDRSVTHVLYWQKLAYEVGNPVEFYELPPLPELKVQKKDDESVVYYLDGDDSYSMTFKNPDTSYYELFNELCVDTFYGDVVKGSAEIDVYSDSVYQGTLHTDYEVDKRLPSAPVFESNAENFHSRGTVKLNVKTIGKSQLYVAVSEPLVLEENAEAFDPDATIFKAVRPGEFTKTGNSIDLVFEPHGEKPIFYKVQAYSVLGNTISDIVEYSVVIDNFNFYYNSAADRETADGTKEHPFVDFAQGIPYINSYRSASLFITGTVKMPEGKTEVATNCEIIGLSNAVIEFPKGAYVSVNSSTLQISNCRIKASGNTGNKSSSGSVIHMDNSVLLLNNCEVTSSGGKNMNLIDANTSVINFSDSLFSVSASTYACLVNGNKTRITVNSCKIGVVGETAVAFSARGSDFILSSSSVRVTGNLGRIAELFEVNGRIFSNDFSADLKRNNGTVEPVYQDKNSRVVQSANYSQGF